MARNPKGVMARSMTSGNRGRGGRAGGKEGKRNLGEKARELIAAAEALEDHGEASARFLELAGIADERGLPQVAAFLALRAGGRRIQAGDAGAAAAAMRTGADHAAGVAEARRVGRQFTRALRDLRQLDAGAADEVGEHARKALGLKSLPIPGEMVTPNRAVRRSLPKACSVCGKTLDPKAVEVEDDGTLDCPRCGAEIV